tara:strand:+ start:379 stop:687 length:309 start_codon:yes stop_codon:yes gene_type:complete
MPIRHKGRKTGDVSQYGVPIYELNGEKFSERSRTLRVDDKYVNVPSVSGDLEYSEDELYDGVMSGKFKPTSAHGSLNEAVNAAIRRSGGIKGRPASGSMEKN